MATLLRCYVATLLRCYSGTFPTLPHCYIATCRVVIGSNMLAFGDVHIDGKLVVENGRIIDPKMIVAKELR